MTRLYEITLQPDVLRASDPHPCPLPRGEGESSPVVRSLNAPGFLNEGMRFSLPRKLSGEGRGEGREATRHRTPSSLTTVSRCIQDKTGGEHRYFQAESMLL